jgi:hypothetical protein
MPTKRHLSSIDAAQSVVSGTGLNGPLEAFQTYSVQVDAKDSSGNDIGVGGDIILLEVRNKCTITHGYF